MYLTDLPADLPVVKGSEISDELHHPGARKLNALCGRWKSPGEANNNPAYTVMFVTRTETLPDAREA